MKLNETLCIVECVSWRAKSEKEGENNSKQKKENDGEKYGNMFENL